ncbi:hypothetical protein ACFV3R_26455 [Streptomyces sp. NPDC059740]|uniref:hypothetical protein n=1 Tax=Streptomyces sp. NPDC059740 TaxID=3346926 RepID=UPI003663CF44
MLTSTVCAALTAAGLGIAVVTAYRRRFLAAVRIAAFALIPLGLVMTGVTDWIENLALNPQVWAGFGVLALSALLFLLGRVAERRSRRTGRRERRAAARSADRAAAGSSPASPPLPQGHTGSRPAATSDATPKEDLSDIEAILKKHGI